MQIPVFNGWPVSLMWMVCHSWTGSVQGVDESDLGGQDDNQAFELLAGGSIAPTGLVQINGTTRVCYALASDLRFDHFLRN